MYSRQNRNPRADVAVEIPRDYSGSAFYPFPSFPSGSEGAEERKMPDQTEECHEAEKCEEKSEEKCEEKCDHAVCESKPIPNGLLGGLSGLLGGNIGLEELLLLGVIFLIFSDDSLRDNELLICLLLILFI